MRSFHMIINRNLRCGQVRQLTSNSNPTTVDDKEVKRFNQLANNWWNQQGGFKALHSMNKLRVPLIKESFSGLDLDSPTPLEGKSILDVGCGGGILSEPIARLGASVIGLDVAQEGIDAAVQRRESLLDPKLDRCLDYVCGSLEEFSETNQEKFDVVVASEVVEHVASLDAFVELCAKVTKPGGHIVVTTINKTTLSYYIGIIAAEYVFSMLPKGTHEWDKFVEPPHLQNTFQKFGCEQTLLHGMSMNPLTLVWSWSGNTDINYAATFQKSSHTP